MGPFLFLVYVNHLVGDNLMYADDATCLITEQNLENLELKANTRVNMFSQQLAMSCLKVNESKTGGFAAGWLTT